MWLGLGSTRAWRVGSGTTPQRHSGHPATAAASRCVRAAAPAPPTQIAGASKWSLDVATAVLRFYQLDPSKASRELIARVLLRALMQVRCVPNRETAVTRPPARSPHPCPAPLTHSLARSCHSCRGPTTRSACTSCQSASW